VARGKMSRRRHGVTSPPISEWFGPPPSPAEVAVVEVRCLW
jgi:hypothetical protein